jgi:maleate isomerase
MLSYETDDGIGTRATLGLVVLRTDETIEHEFRAFLPEDGVALYHTRVASADTVSSETLATMRAEIPRAVDLLPPDAGYDVIGYACTSGATVIGPANVAAGVRTRFPGVTVTDPLTAARTAFAVLGIRRLVLLSPYVAEVSAALRTAFEASGVEIVAFESFDVELERVVARMTPASLLVAIEATVAAARAAGKAPDGVFMSCTNLRLAPILEEAERRAGVPVLSSNQVLAWHMLRAAGIDDDIPGYGRLFRMMRPEGTPERALGAVLVPEMIAER